MRFIRRGGGAWMIVALAVIHAGCTPGSGSYDEQKDTHFLQGKRRQQNMDYRGAIESFEKALEVNPKSSSAHFEMGLLYAEEMNKDVLETNQRDLHHATAIYHFEKFLALNPQSPLADRVQQQITACKLELAKTVSFTLLSSAVQKELERLNATNAVLRQYTEQLRLQLAQQAHGFSNHYAALRSQYLAAVNAAANPTGTAMSDRTAEIQDVAPREAVSPRVESRPERVPDRSAASSHPPPSGPRGSAPVRPSNSHVVRSGETLASIARQHKVALSALLAANPGIEPRRMRVGQTVRIPASENR